MLYIYKKIEMVNYTSSLPEDIMAKLELYSQEFRLPKNRIIEKALRAYFDTIKQAQYVHSFRVASGEAEQKSMAEEGLEDYLKIISAE